MDLKWESIRKGPLKYPRPEGFPVFPERTMQVYPKENYLVIGLNKTNFNSSTSYNIVGSSTTKILQKNKMTKFMLFLKQHWKIIMFPICCIFVFVIDYYIGYSFYFSIIKIIFVSFLFLLYNKKSKLIENSDVYHYLMGLKYEYEKKHIIKPFLTSTQSSIIFFLIFLLVILKNDNTLGPFLSGLFIFLTGLLILDSLNIFLRSLTNKAELKSIRTPASLKQMRFVFTTATKIMPIIVPAGKFFFGAVVFSEVIYPEFTQNTVELGPLTKYHANSNLHKDLKVPIETSLDLKWESIREGQLKYPRPEGFSILPERTTSLYSKKDCLHMGLSEMNFDSLTGANTKGSY